MYIRFCKDVFILELDLVHRTIVGLFCVLFHAAKLRHEDAKEWREFYLNSQWPDIYRRQLRRRTMAILLEEDFPISTIVRADMEDDYSFLKGCQVVLDGVFGFPNLVGQSFAGDFGVGHDGVNDGLGGPPNFWRASFPVVSG